MTRLLYNPPRVVVTTEKSSGEESLAFDINVKSVNHGGQDAMVVLTPIVLKCFFAGDFHVAVFVEEVVSESVPVVESSLHDGSSQVLVGTGNCKCLVFFQLAEILDELGWRLTHA